jgi:hypothetical protein
VVSNLAMSAAASRAWTPFRRTVQPCGVAHVAADEVHVSHAGIRSATRRSILCVLDARDFT